MEDEQSKKLMIDILQGPVAAPAVSFLGMKVLDYIANDNGFGLGQKYYNGAVGLLKFIEKHQPEGSNLISNISEKVLSNPGDYAITLAAIALLSHIITITYNYKTGKYSDKKE